MPLIVPTGDAVLGMLPKLLAALDGSGPGLQPVNPDTQLEPIGEQAERIALVVSTSGSTGEPKRVLLPASALRHAATAGQRRLLDGDPGSWLLTLPAQHIAGLMVLIRSALAGREPVVMDVSRPFTADSFAAAADRLPNGPAFVSLVPTQLHRLAASRHGIAALRRFAGVLVGGAATAPELIGKATAAGVAIVTTYGMSETCGGCVYNGRALDGVTVSLEESSRIRLAGPLIAAGYAGRRYQPPFGLDPRTGERSFDTSDVGALGAAGELTVLGRLDDMLITGGVNVAPQAVEHALAGATGVGEVALTGVPDPQWGQRLVAVVVRTGTAVPSLDELRRLATAAIGPAAAPKDLLLVDSLPTRGPGKLDRAAVADLARNALGWQDS